MSAIKEVELSEEMEGLFRFIINGKTKSPLHSSEQIYSEKTIDDTVLFIEAEISSAIEDRKTKIEQFKKIKGFLKTLRDDGIEIQVSGQAFILGLVEKEVKTPIDPDYSPSRYFSHITFRQKDKGTKDNICFCDIWIQKTKLLLRNGFSKGGGYQSFDDFEGFVTKIVEGLKREDIVGYIEKTIFYNS